MTMMMSSGFPRIKIILHFDSETETQKGMSIFLFIIIIMFKNVSFMTTLTNCFSFMYCASFDMG